MISIWKVQFRQIPRFASKQLLVLAALKGLVMDSKSLAHLSATKTKVRLPVKPI